MDLRGACVVAKSPLLRIHGNALFLTEVKTGCGLDSKHFLLARGNEAASLYSDINVGSYYDVDHVTPTTITKGTDRPRKILLLSASSKISPCNKDVDPIETNIPSLECTVSKCFDKTLGIYELKDNNRLYLTYQYDGKSHLPSIPIGSKVIVHNAHKVHVLDRESELGSYDSIACCMRTSVNVESLSEQQQPPKEKSGNVQRVLLPLCGKLFPSLPVLEWLRHQAIPTLLHKLVPSILKLKDMLPVLLQLLTSKMTSNDLPIIEEKKRNPYEDFLSHDKACHLVQSCDHITRNVPCTFPKVGELVDCLAPSTADGRSHISSLNQSGWTCRMLRSCDVPISMVLVAKLCCNGTDGRLFLSDATGSIPCTLAKIMPLKKHTKSSHKPDNKKRTEVKDMIPESSSTTCNESYQGERTEIEDDDESRLSTSSCFPQPCLNHLLRIDDFVVILENKSSDAESSSEAQVPSDAALQSSKGHSNGSSNEMRGYQVRNQGQSSKVIMYVMFNPRNVTCLHRGTERAASSGCMRPRRRKRSSTNSEGSSPESTTISKTFLLRTRRQLLQERRDGSKAGSTTPSFYCDILILDSDHPPKKTKNDATLRHGEGDGEKKDEGARKQEEIMDGGKAALLCLHGDAVRWYNFLQEGEVYKMDCKHTDMQAHVVPSIMKLSKKGMTQPVYIITSYSQLQILLDSTYHHIHQTTNVASSADVYQTNKGKHGQRLSSISGLITRKTIRSSSIEEAHTSREDPIAQMSSSIHVEIEDLTTHTTASVSVPTHIHEDNLGLVPGASVSFRNCLMKIDPGIEVTYDIGPLTSIRVENFCTESFRNIASTPSPQHSAQQALDATGHLTSRQRSFLYHMIQDTSRDSSQVSWVYAHVTAITKLILRWICKNCGRNDCKCPALGRQDGKIITQVLLAVDDGTGECLIWSNRPNVVSAALGLSPRQWTVLEESCTGPNKELVYHKWSKGRKEEYNWEAGSGSGPRQSRLVLAVSKLCQHWTVQCSLWFKTRYFRESTKEMPSDSDKSAWPAGLVLCCEEVSF